MALRSEQSRWLIPVVIAAVVLLAFVVILLLRPKGGLFTGQEWTGRKNQSAIFAINKMDYHTSGTFDYESEENPTTALLIPVVDIGDTLGSQGNNNIFVRLFYRVYYLFNGLK